MKKKKVLNIFKKTGAFLNGHFKLSSGLHSRHYLQCAKVLQHPKHTEVLCKELAKKFPRKKINTVIAPALGGVVVSYAVGKSLGVKSLFTERVEGKMTLRRGFELTKKDNVLVVEDVVTTGLSTKEVIKVVKSYGAKVIGVGCVVDRSKRKINFGAPFKSIIKIDVPAFDPKKCPLCKEKIPIKKPGSRK